MLDTGRSLNEVGAVVLDSGSQSKRISGRWLAMGAGSLLLVMMLPSILLLAKIAVGLIMVPVVAIAMRVALKTISKALEGKQEGQNQATQQTTRSRIINLAVGLLSTFAGGLSLFTVARIGLTAACAAVAALVLYGYLEDEKIGKGINDKLDGMAGSATDFIVGNIEKLIPQQSRQV